MTLDPEGADDEAVAGDVTGPGRFRAARTEDRVSIVEVAEASGLFPPEELAEVVATFDAFVTGATGADRWVVDDAGSEVAAVAYYAPERMTDGTWNLYLLAVHPRHQREGRGAGLVRHVEQQLRASGARVLLIETSGVPDFAGQRSFYLGLGYREEARIRDFYELGDDKVVYWKDLTANDHRVDDPPPSRSQLPGTTVGLRVADSSDISSLVRLAEDFYREDGFATSTEDLQRNLGVLLASDAAHVVVIEEDGGPVGFAVTTTSFGLESGLIAELEDLYVEPSSRRRGHAERLVNDADSWARQAGCSHIEVVTAPNGRDLSHLHAYYEARGFADEGRQLRIKVLR